jgi:UDP-N-acetylglucosamine 2-epimerase (non-hydrolysing)
MTSRIRLAIILGTRPEAVKMAPIIRRALERPDAFDVHVVSTSQHREMLDQMLAAFQIRADVDLQLMQPNQGLTEFASRALAALAECFDRIKPAVVLVQGDTTTVVAAALAAFHRKILVGHVEAGLRSFDRFDPFPEEINRRLTATLATLHFAPTQESRANLVREGVPEERIFVTGNTVVDALQMIELDERFDSADLREVPLDGNRLILVTAHRRENHGKPLLGICAALKSLVVRFPDVHIVFPVHLHPVVRTMVHAELAGVRQISLIEPVGYPDLLRLLRKSYIVMTDSGGIQEESPSFRKPVLILRATTERPEVVAAGGAMLVGTRADRIVSETANLLDNRSAYERMCLDNNPFGDGHAATTILDILETTQELRN